MNRSMLSTAFVTGIAGLLLVSGCETAATQRQTRRTEVSQKDAEQELTARFDKVYMELACQANHGKDPLSNLMPLERPGQYLERIESMDGVKRDRALHLLATAGFSSIRDFLSVEVMMKAKKAYWQSLQDRLIEEILKCKK